MSFHDTRFPTDISYNSDGGPDWLTDVVRFRSGVEARNQVMANPVHAYDVRRGVKTPAQQALLVAFFHARRGRVHTFPYKDWTDYSSAADGRSAPTPTDQLIGTGNGANVTFQLTKTYADAVNPWVRTITKPITATVRIAINDAEKLPGDATYPWTVARLTGIVTFTAAAPPNGQSVKAGFQFDVPVRFDTDTLRVALTTDRTLDASVTLIEPREC